MISEDQLEQQCLTWFRDGGREAVFGPDIALYHSVSHNSFLIDG